MIMEKANKILSTKNSTVDGVEDSLNLDLWSIPLFVYKKVQYLPKIQPYTIKQNSVTLFRIRFKYSVKKAGSKFEIISYHSFPSEKNANFYSSILRDILELRGRLACDKLANNVRAMSHEELVVLLCLLQKEKEQIITEQQDRCVELQRQVEQCKLCPYFSHVDMRHQKRGRCSHGAWVEKLRIESVSFPQTFGTINCKSNQLLCEKEPRELTLTLLKKISIVVFDNLLVDDIHLVSPAPWRTMENRYCDVLYISALLRREITGHQIDDALLRNYLFTKSESMGAFRSTNMTRFNDRIHAVHYNEDMDVYIKKFVNSVNQIVIVINLTEERGKLYLPETLCSQGHQWLPDDCPFDQINIIVNRRYSWWATILPCSRCCSNHVKK